MDHMKMAAAWRWQQQKESSSFSSEEEENTAKKKFPSFLFQKIQLRIKLFFPLNIAKQSLEHTKTMVEVPKGQIFPLLEQKRA